MDQNRSALLVPMARPIVLQDAPGHLRPPPVVAGAARRWPSDHQAAISETPATDALFVEPLTPAGPEYAGGAASYVGAARTDTLAVASAVCGFTAIVPVVSQVLGLGLGVASLLRIRQARRCGLKLRGRGWALAGIFSSGFVLLSWLAVFGVLLAVGRSFGNTAGVLQALGQPGH